MIHDFQRKCQALVMFEFSGMWNNYSLKKPTTLFEYRIIKWEQGWEPAASTTGLGPAGISWRSATRGLPAWQLLLASLLYYLKSQTLKRSRKLNREGLRNILISFPCHCCWDLPDSEHGYANSTVLLKLWVLYLCALLTNQSVLPLGSWTRFTGAQRTWVP